MKKEALELAKSSLNGSTLKADRQAAAFKAAQEAGVTVSEFIRARLYLQATGLRPQELEDEDQLMK
jgi:hypothetical protein